MNIKTDEYTGEKYDADEWYRGANALWINKKAEAEFREKCAAREAERRARRNASRKARGLRPRSDKSFAKSAARYSRFLAIDSGLSFGEWLKLGSKHPLSYGYND